MLMANKLLESQDDNKIIALYNSVKDDKKVKWKDSIKKIANLELAVEKGLDN
jgi:nicotinic acid mononucleotide adenylyltransferase